jgi:hypothetical protein
MIDPGGVGSLPRLYGYGSSSCVPRHQRAYPCVRVSGRWRLSARWFRCIKTFWNGSGYVMECHDGMYSKSGGRSGSCSYHGGNWRPLYAP